MPEKKTVKIKFVDFWDHWNEEENFLVRVLRKHFRVVFSESPDYLFFSNFSKRLDHLEYPDAIRIFYTQENLCPDFNLCDYGIGYDNLHFSDRYMQFPICFIEERYGQSWQRMMDKGKVLQEMDDPAAREFCSFVVSNKDADPMRDLLYESLRTYRPIASGGRYKNTVGMPRGVPDKHAFLHKYKFTLCCENTSHPGYYTEKLVEAFAANTIPVYWGDPAIAEVFNEDAFINLMNGSSLEEMIEKVRAVDQDDTAYRYMLAQPALKPGQTDIWERKQMELERFLVHIFSQEKEEAYRRNREFWGERYYRLYKDMRNVYVLLFQNRVKTGFVKQLKALRHNLP